jgi:predicted TIM-barrel fold metal-dependent hydrolase
MTATRARIATKTIDADGHIVEPADLWDRYLPARLREGARAALSTQEYPDGGTSLVLEGRTIIRRIQATSFVGRRAGTFSDLSLHEGQAGGWDPKARLADMDLDGIDTAVLYTSWAHVLVAVRDYALAAAMARAYNDWLADYCRADPGRLHGVALVPLQDVPVAVRELRRAVSELGFKAVMVRPNRHAGRFLHDPHFDPFWREAEALDVPIGFHPFPFPDLDGAFPIVDSQIPDRLTLSSISHLPIDNMLTMMHLVMSGTLERFPRLRVAFLESYGGWALMWVDRLNKYFVQSGYQDRGDLKTAPGEIFARQIYISFEPDERSLPLIAETLGADNILWASDYPHFDATFPGVVRELKETVERLPEAVQRKIIGENAARFYRLPS